MEILWEFVWKIVSSQEKISSIKYQIHAAAFELEGMSTQSEN